MDSRRTVRSSLPESYDSYESALIAAGTPAAGARNQLYAIRAAARTLGKNPADLTDLDAEIYGEARGLNRRSVGTLRGTLRRWQHWRATGMIRARYSSGSRTGDWSMEFQAWLTRDEQDRPLLPGSARTYANHVGMVAWHYKLHPDQLTAAHVRAWLNERDQNGATYPYLNCVRRGCELYGEFTGRELVAGVRKRVNRRRRNAARPRPAADALLSGLLACNDPYVRAMTLLGAWCGMRSFEIAKARHEDFRRSVHGGWDVVIEGKGAKRRTVPVGAAVVQQLTDSGVLVPGGTGRLFPHLSEQQYQGGREVNDALREAAQALGHRLTSHQLRHAYASRLYARTKDIVVVQQRLGHASPETTIRYVEALTDSVSAANDVMDADLLRLAA